MASPMLATSNSAASPPSVARISRARTVEPAVTTGTPAAWAFPMMPLGPLLVRTIGATSTADGFHFTPEFHRVIGTRLAEEIGEWADTQPHLAR